MKTLHIFSLFLFFLISIETSTVAQIGGNATYKFLEIPNSAKVAALGGNIISLNDGDLNFVYHNPALLSDAMNNVVLMNYVSYFADVKFGYLAYANTFPKTGTISAGIHYINYGTFTRANELGQKTGSFTAAEYAMNISWAKRIDSLFTLGITFKPLYSQLESYTSYGLAIDLGATYNNPLQQFTAALVVKNIGSQIKPYVEGNYEPLPFDIQFGISKKLAHAPFRVHLLAHHLYRYKMVVERPKNQSIYIVNNLNTVSESKFNTISDNVLRHFNFAIEFLPFKSFAFNLGYNYQRRKELQLEERAGFTGISWGFSLRMKKMDISYGRARYHFAAVSNNFSIAVHLSEFHKRNISNNQPVKDIK